MLEVEPTGHCGYSHQKWLKQHKAVAGASSEAFTKGCTIDMLLLNCHWWDMFCDMILHLT